MRTVDRLNLRFGRDNLTFTDAGISLGFPSPCYTTAWD